MGKAVRFALVAAAALIVVGLIASFVTGKATGVLLTTAAPTRPAVSAPPARRDRSRRRTSSCTAPIPAAISMSTLRSTAPRFASSSTPAPRWWRSRPTMPAPPGILSGGLDFSQITNTANGQARVALTTLRDVRLEQLSIDNVAAVVMEQPMAISLLGMSFLAAQRLQHPRRRADDRVVRMAALSAPGDHDVERFRGKHPLNTFAYDATWRQSGRRKWDIPHGVPASGSVPAARLVHPRASAGRCGYASSRAHVSRHASLRHAARLPRGAFPLCLRSPSRGAVLDPHGAGGGLRRLSVHAARRRQPRHSGADLGPALHLRHSVRLVPLRRRELAVLPLARDHAFGRHVLPQRPAAAPCPAADRRADLVSLRDPRARCRLPAAYAGGGVVGDGHHLGAVRLRILVGDGALLRQYRRRATRGARGRGREASRHRSEAAARQGERRARRPRQVRVPRQYEPRAAHAAQRHHRLLRGDAQRDVRRRSAMQRYGEYLAGHPRQRAPSARASSTTSSTSPRSRPARRARPRGEGAARDGDRGARAHDVAAGGRRFAPASCSTSSPACRG